MADNGLVRHRACGRGRNGPAAGANDREWRDPSRSGPCLAALAGEADGSQGIRWVRADRNGTWISRSGWPERSEAARFRAASRNRISTVSPSGERRPGSAAPLPRVPTHPDGDELRLPLGLDETEEPLARSVQSFGDRLGETRGERGGVSHRWVSRQLTSDIFTLPNAAGTSAFRGPSGLVDQDMGARSPRCECIAAPGRRNAAADRNTRPRNNEPSRDRERGER